jgi:D-alanyl-lipoteichoic acid acyltransferase DltB (MBOAT superfamily)
MAIGIALLFNITLPINFNSPYKATSIQDFWRRWHMTLSRFLKDYVYIPLGGNRKGAARTYFNLFLTFLLGGIWHGAGWTFVFWGALHGLALMIYRAWHKLGMKLPTLLAWFITFNFVNIAWVFFRAREWDDALKVLHGMFFGKVVLPASFVHHFSSLKQYSIEFGKYLHHLHATYDTPLWILFGFILTLFMKNSVQQTATLRLSTVSAVFSALMFSIAVLSMNKISEFLYFNF